MSAPLVGIAMGSDSDLPVLEPAAGALADLGIAHEVRVVSAHRTPDAMLAYGREAAGRGLRVLIAGAGGAAHLPGMLAAMTVLPVIGVPVPLRHLDGLDSLLSIVQMPRGVPVALRRLDGLDSLLSIVQMPRGVPVATVAVDGARNAGLLAARILATADPALAQALRAAQDDLAAAAEAADARVRQSHPGPGGPPHAQ